MKNRTTDVTDKLKGSNEGSVRVFKPFMSVRVKISLNIELLNR
jgi:hypothetical protein